LGAALFRAALLGVSLGVGYGYLLVMDQPRTRNGWLVALLALALLTFGVSPALASAGCGLMVADQPCAEMTEVGVHAGHGDLAEVEQGASPDRSPDLDHNCDHQHCHMSAGLDLSLRAGSVTGLPGTALVAIGGDDPRVQQPGFRLEHPPRV
jgi:hypothetical protein